MKSPSFAGLLYREFFLVKKRYIIAFSTVIGVSLLCVLAALSFQYGNLAMLKDTANSAETIKGIELIVKLYPIIAAGMLCFAVTEASVNDVTIQWERFRRCTPVSSVKFALAKYILFAVSILFSCGFSVAINASLCYILHSSVMIEDVSICIVGAAIFSIICVVSQIAVTLVKSMDKAMIIIMGILIATVVPIAIANGKDNSNVSFADRIGEIDSFCTKLLPFIPLIIIGTLAIGFVVTTMLYNRREK